MSFDPNIERRQPTSRELHTHTIKKHPTPQDWKKWQKYKSNKDLVLEAWERQEEEE